MNTTLLTLYDKYLNRARVAFRRREIAAMSDADLFKALNDTLDRLAANIYAPPPSPSVQQFARRMLDEHNAAMNRMAAGSEPDPHRLSASARLCIPQAGEQEGGA